MPAEHTLDDSARERADAPDRGPVGLARMSRGRLVGGAIVLFAATIVAYAPVYRAGFIWDDDDYVTQNETLRTLDGLRRIWCEPGAVTQYYPLTYSTFWVEFQVWGLNPVGYHAANVILHAFNAILFWLVLRRLGLRWAWFAAAVFALHPVHVQSVAWVTERKNVLSGLFYLLSTLAYLRFRPLNVGSVGARGRRPVAYVLALLAFLAAMLSKTATCTLPAALLLLTWWKRGRLAWRDAAPLIPLFGLALGLGVMTMLLEFGGMDEAEGAWELSAVDRTLIAGRAVWFYLGKLLWPVNLIHVYPRWTIDAHAWWQYLFPAAALWLLGVLWAIRRRVGNGPLVALLFFGGTLLPALGFVNVAYMQYSFVADHLQYLPSLGIIALGVALAGAVCRRLGPTTMRAAPALGAVVLLACGTAAWRQTLIYKDRETLWRDTVAKDPASWRGNFGLGTVLATDKKPAEAIPYLEAALRAYPNDLVTLTNLANAYHETQRYGDALRTYKLTLLQKPDDYLVHYNLGLLYSRLGRYDQAAAHLVQAVRIEPGFDPARRSLERLRQLQRLAPSSQPWGP